MSKTSINQFIDNLDVSSGAYRILLIIAALLVVLIIFLNSHPAYGPSEVSNDSVPTETETIQEHESYFLIKD